MFSLYIHIPFCEKKCNYCNFYIVPFFQWVEGMKNRYLQALKQELLQKKALLKDNKIYTIYFWWWTPSEFWIQRIIELLNFIKEQFDISNIEEFNFELNPSPLDQSLKFIYTLKDFFWKNITRFSIWIQSLEDEVLKKSNRNYDYKLIEKFLDSIDTTNFKLNLDFISFGIEKNIDIFDNFLKKYNKKIDSLSIYTLELFPGSIWQTHYKVDEEKIVNIFEKNIYIAKKYGFYRYEISNFAKNEFFESKHNKVYWTLQEYLWIWVSASWFIQNTRYTNSFSIQNYIEKKFDYQEKKFLSKDDFYIEKFFLLLRTNKGFTLDENIKKYLNLDKLEELIKTWYIDKDKNKNTIFLNDKWFLVYNYLITEILEKI